MVMWVMPVNQDPKKTAEETLQLCSPPPPPPTLTTPTPTNIANRKHLVTLQLCSPPPPLATDTHNTNTANAYTNTNTTTHTNQHSQQHTTNTTNNNTACREKKASELTYRYDASRGVLRPSVWVMEVCVSIFSHQGPAQHDIAHHTPQRPQERTIQQPTHRHTLSGRMIHAINKRGRHLQPLHTPPNNPALP
jgi:hypothetical protein